MHSFLRRAACNNGLSANLLGLTVGLLLVGLVGPASAAAQVDTTGAVLPDIAPREVEIRGTLEISFPSLQRQPLIGFNPPPRVPDVPAGRRPFVESYRDASPMQDVAQLRRPESPTGLAGAAFAPAGGLVEVGGGRYYSRFANARISTPLSPQAALLTRLDYEGSDGATPFDDQPEARAAFDVLDGRIAVQSASSRGALSGGLEGFYTTYDLYGAGDVVSASPLPFLDQPHRQGNRLAGDIRFTSGTGGPVNVHLGLQLSGTGYETTLRPDSLDIAPDDMTERRVDFDGGLSVPFSSGAFWVDAAASTGSLGDDLGSTTSIDAGAGVRFALGRTLSLRVGGRFLAAFSDTEQPLDANEPIEVGYASPDVRLEWMIVQGLLLYARHRPGVTANGLASVFRAQPYLIAQPILRPTLRSVDGEAGISFFQGPLQLHARGGYQEYPQYLFFEHEPTVYAEGFTALRYAEVEIMHAGGSIAARLPGGLYAMLDVTYRDTRLPNQEDADVPYIAPMVGEATLSYAFAQRHGLLQVTGRYESARYRDRAQTRKLDAFINLDVEASYRFTPHIGIVTRLDNIGGSNNAQWDRYPISPFVLGAGLQVHW